MSNASKMDAENALKSEEPPSGEGDVSNGHRLLAPAARGAHLAAPGCVAAARGAHLAAPGCVAAVNGAHQVAPGCVAAVNGAHQVAPGCVAAARGAHQVAPGCVAAAKPAGGMRAGCSLGPGAGGAGGWMRNSPVTGMRNSAAAERFATELREAQAGDAAAQLSVGLRYLEGDGTAVDYKRADEWFLKAAAQGNRGGLFEHGQMLFWGKGMTADATQAADFFMKAAQKDHVKAQFWMGVLLAEGDGIPRDDRAAFEWFKRSAAGGNIESLLMLGECYERGLGCEADLEQAQAYYNVAANKLSLDAQKALSRIRQSGGKDLGEPWRYSAEYCFGIGNAYMRSGRADKAQCWMKKASAYHHTKAAEIVAWYEKKMQEDRE